MFIETESNENQRAHNVLSQIETAFEDIYLIFGLFNSNPIDILTLLKNEPSNREDLKEVMAKREYFSTHPLFGPSKVIIASVKRSSSPKVFTKKDINDWFNKRLSSLTALFTFYEQELGLTEPGTHVYIYWTQRYMQLFDRLSKQLTVFEEKVWDEVSEQIDDRKVEWREFYETLQAYPDFVKWHIVQYSKIFSPNLINTLSILIPMANIKQPRPFSELLAENYSIDDLEHLLVYLRIRDSKRQTIWPQGKKSGLWGVINALVHKNYLIQSTKKEQISSLSHYLGLKDTRVKEGYSIIQIEVKEKAISFLNQPIKASK